MKHRREIRWFFLVSWLVVASTLLGCGLQSPPPAVVAAPTSIPRPSNAILISVVYSGESEQYMPAIMEAFNRAYAEGRHPVTGQALADNERPIYVTGRDQSAGDVLNMLIRAAISSEQAGDALPTIWNPSVSHFLELVNHQIGRDICNVAESRPTAYAPVVMAIWESRLQAIRTTIGSNDIGWTDLIDVLHSPNGWQDYGLEDGRRTVYYGHTDPYFSPTALSTLMAEFYASARRNGFTGRRLTLDVINDPDVQAGVRDIEQLIRHYSRRTTEFRQYIAQGPDYLDFVALEENDVIAINRGLTDYTPPERLVALYPKEGTFWHEHPMCIIEAEWTTPEQRQAASVFVDYVLTADNQQAIMSHGFRPVNPDVEVGFPIVPENGVDPEQPTTILDIPDTDVVAAVQASWEYVKKQADIMLLIDISASMQEEGKLAQAQQAAEAFLDEMDSSNRVGLAVFSRDVQVLVPLQDFETGQTSLRAAIRGLQSVGGTELFLAVRDVVSMMSGDAETDHIRAVVVLSDGEDTGIQEVTLNDAIRAITASHDDLNPVIVIPVAYGSDAAIQQLNSIARASNTSVQLGDPNNILAVLEIIASFF